MITQLFKGNVFLPYELCGINKYSQYRNSVEPLFSSVREEYCANLKRALVGMQPYSTKPAMFFL